MLSTLLSLLLVTPTAIPNQWSGEEKRVAQAIRESSLRAHVQFLADDLLEGRAPGTRGGHLGMRYVAANFARLGLLPVNGAQDYYQWFDIVGVDTQVIVPPQFRAGRHEYKLSPGVDAVVTFGAQTPATQINDAEVVFVGYGISAPEQNWDDFKDVDVRGKVLLVMNDDPSHDPSLFAGKARLYYGRWSYKYEEAARRGATGVIIIHTPDSAGYPWSVVVSSWSGEQFELPSGAEPRLQARMWATEEASRNLVRLGGFDLDELRRRAQRRDFRPVPLATRMKLALSTTMHALRTANVLGLLPGKTAPLSDEGIVVTAHHDHLGKKSGPGDQIYNGALDNASGVATLLTMAEALVDAKVAPARSILFAAVAAEESGLLGSEYFCAHPPVDPKRLAANLNFDGFNIWGKTRDLQLVGLGKTDIDGVVRTALAAQGRTLIGDLFPERGLFYRSDQFNFARIGVPAVYIGAGLDYVDHPPGWGKQQVDAYIEQHYHQPSDEYRADWNLTGALDDIRVATTVALRLSRQKNRPEWNAGDEFSRARAAATAK